SSSRFKIKLKRETARYKKLNLVEREVVILDASTQFKDVRSVAVFIKEIDGSISSRVINYIDFVHQYSDGYSGILYVSDLEGNVFNLLRYSNGYKTHELRGEKLYAYLSGQYISGKHSYQAQGECDRSECGHSSDNPNCICNVQFLDEVVVGGGGNENEVILPDLSDGGDSGGSDQPEDPNHDEGLGGGGSYPIDEPQKEECTDPSQYWNSLEKKCMKKPCPGDPTYKPEIAPQKWSKYPGARLGWTRKYADGSDKYHNGLDIKNPQGFPIFAPYDGTLYKTPDERGDAGYISTLIFTAPTGERVQMDFFHMQKDNRRTGPVKQGEVIGYQGDSGNLANAIKEGTVESHYHMKCTKPGVPVDKTTARSHMLNCEKYLKQKFNEDGSQKANNGC
ncbi:M23 family metallopeptidase, partial [Flavobacteriaceae bacterium]|nr:M23 family metallopeptidase [Flavobacteriaceae bacterium]